MVYRFPLIGVQQLRIRDRDAAADSLAQARLAESKLNEELERIMAEHASQLPIQAMAGEGVVSAQRIMESQRYQTHLLLQANELRAQLELVRGEVEKRRQALVKREQAVRAMEQLEEQRRGEWHTEEERKAQEVMDQWASYQHWKQGRA